MTDRDERRSRGTRALWAYLALPVLLLIAVVAESARMPLVAAVAVGVGLSWVAGLSLHPRLYVEWAWPTGLPWYVGDTITFRTTVSNRAQRPSPPLTVEHGSAGMPLPPVTVPPLAPGETATVRVAMHLGRRRGPAPLTAKTKLHNRLGGPSLPMTPMGTKRTLPAVRPRPDLPPAWLLERLARPTEDGVPAGVRGNADPLLLRHFASGDPVSAVHWRSTARAGVPVVMERERVAGVTLVLLVCASGTGAAWEQSIARAAGLIEAARRAGVAVAVVAAEPASGPSGGPGHDAVQDWLAGLGHAGPAQPALLEGAVRRAAGGVVGVLSAEPWLASEVADLAPAGTVVDLARPW